MFFRRERKHEPARAGEKAAQQFELLPAGIFGNEALRRGGETEIDQPADQQHPGPGIDVDAEFERAHPAREQHLREIGERGGDDTDEERRAGGALRTRVVGTIGKPAAHQIGRAPRQGKPVFRAFGESHAWPRVQD